MRRVNTAAISKRKRRDPPVRRRLQSSHCKDVGETFRDRSAVH